MGDLHEGSHSVPTRIKRLREDWSLRTLNKVQETPVSRLVVKDRKERQSVSDIDSRPVTLRSSLYTVKVQIRTFKNVVEGVDERK